ncbi:unnamed protein product [Lymnaea stagnalis]|uniref:FAS1 domain-containing protein n=1 Tax=Lymnaea stagnalis TaxID=6523 RepID=A0AAV2IGZ8_LYMST
MHYGSFLLILSLAVAKAADGDKSFLFLDSAVDVEEARLEGEGRAIIPDLLTQMGLDSLVSLVNKAGLTATLSGPGPFTVFAPTNEAFFKLPEWVQKAVSNVTILTDILKYHVLAGNVKSSALANELLVDTVLPGKKLRINLYKKQDATVATAQCAPIDLDKVDEPATNGIVHFLNRVMLPPAGDMVTVLNACSQFKTLVAAVRAAGLANALSGDGPFTLFAPTDRAFRKLPPQALDNLLKNATALTRVLQYHVVPGTFCSAGLFNSDVSTLATDKVKIEIIGAKVKVNNARVIVADASVTNGVVHAINQVLIPPNIRPSSTYRNGLRQLCPT